MTKNYRADYWDRVIWEEIRGFLSNPDKVIKGMKKHQQQIEILNRPAKKRLAITDDLIKEKKKELNRLLDLYLSGEFEKNILTARKQHLEETILALETERESLYTQTRLSLSNKQIAELQALSEDIIGGLNEADGDFALRKRMLNFLGVQVTLSVEDGRQVALLKCEFGLSRWLIMGDDKITYISSPPPELEQSANSHEEGEGNCMPNRMRNMGCSCS
jgi:hypothetical protein